MDVVHSWGMELVIFASDWLAGLRLRGEKQKRYAAMNVSCAQVCWLFVGETRENVAKLGACCKAGVGWVRGKT
jgi:hypothetical protein